MESTSKKLLDEDSIEKKFIGAKNTQDCIQSVALWALANKSQHDQIVSMWLNSVKKSKVSRRLTLFYICNEIVQTCRKKHALIFKDAFKEVLKDATLLVRDKTVSDSVERMFNIWKERDVFEEEFISSLLKILKDSNIESSDTKLLSDFKLNEFIEKIQNIAQLEEEVQIKTKKMQNINVDSLNLNYTKLLKDRQHGFVYTSQVEEFQKQLADFVSKSEQLRKLKEDIANDLDFCSLYYEAQYGEARIVANAYRSFGNRIRNIQKKLGDLRKTLPDPLSPIPSPSYDAPSPPDSINDCMSPLSDHPPLPNDPPPIEDILQPIDMEFSDDEETPSSKTLSNQPKNAAQLLQARENCNGPAVLEFNRVQQLLDIPTPTLKLPVMPNGLNVPSFKISDSNMKTGSPNAGITSKHNLEGNRRKKKSFDKPRDEEVVDLTDDDVIANRDAVTTDRGEHIPNSASEIFKSLQILAMSIKVPINIESQMEMKHLAANNLSTASMQHTLDSLLKNETTNSATNNQYCSASSKNEELDQSPERKLAKLRGGDDRFIFQSKESDAFYQEPANSPSWKAIKIVDDVYDDDEDVFDSTKKINLMSTRRSAYAIANQNDSNEPEEPAMRRFENLRNLRNFSWDLRTDQRQTDDSMTSSTMGGQDSKEPLPQINAELIEMLIENISCSQSHTNVTSDYIETLEMGSVSDEGELKEYEEVSIKPTEHSSSTQEQIIDYGHGDPYRADDRVHDSLEGAEGWSAPTTEALPMPPPPPFLINRTPMDSTLMGFAPPPMRPQYIEPRHFAEMRQTIQATRPPPLEPAPAFRPTNHPFALNDGDFRLRLGPVVEANNNVSSRLMSPKDFQNKMLSSPPVNHNLGKFAPNVPSLQENKNQNIPLQSGMQQRMPLTRQSNLVNRDPQFQPYGQLQSSESNPIRPNIMQPPQLLQNNVNFRPSEDFNRPNFNQQFRDIRPALIRTFDTQRHNHPENSNFFYENVRNRNPILSPQGQRPIFERSCDLRGQFAGPPRLRTFEMRPHFNDAPPYSNFSPPRFEQNIRFQPR